MIEEEEQCSEMAERRGEDRKVIIGKMGYYDEFFGARAHRLERVTGDPDF
jgi:hypothetical protein